jgi:hypothetical protein
MKPTPAPKSTVVSAADAATLARRHLRFGWWSLLVFLSLGIVLESLHAFKVSWYLNVSNETRRLMLTLAHAHGTLLALVNMGFAVTLPSIATWEPKVRRFAGACLLAASLLIPAGFFLGGLGFNAGDPGLGILLVPAGAVCLLVAVFLTAAAFRLGARTAKG